MDHVEHAERDLRVAMRPRKGLDVELAMAKWIAGNQRLSPSERRGVAVVVSVALFNDAMKLVALCP